MVRGAVLLAIAAVAFASSSSAQPDPVREGERRLPVIDAQDLPVRQKSYLVPAAEILIGNLTLSVTVQVMGIEWGQVSLATIERNLTTAWELDEDAYSTNQLGHPFTGAMLFSTARSTGHGFWVSGAYAFAGSLLWEVFLENEIPSINDQITTPIGGMLIGEALHRFGRALRYRGSGTPSLARRAGAAILDPVGTVNRAWWGDAWARTVPPNLNAHFGVGFNQPTTILGEHRGATQLHVQAEVEHGLGGDRAFQPRHPLDHFTLETAVGVSRDDIAGELYVRGMLVGAGRWSERLRGVAGLFGAYDYNGDDHVRASMLGVGPGATGELPLGERGYIAGTVAAYLVPYGAAGGVNETEGPMRDHHDGPGLAQLAELAVGKRGLFSVRLTSRAYEIAGRVVGDRADELVVVSTLGARVNLTRHHALAVEGQYGFRHARFSEAPMPSAGARTDRASELRAFWAITTDEILGR